MLWPLVPFVARIERQGCGGWKVPTVEDVTTAMTALQTDPADTAKQGAFISELQKLGFRSIEMPANRKAAAINDEITDRVNQFGTTCFAFLTANTAAFSVLQEKCETQITWAMGTQYKWLGDFEGGQEKQGAKGRCTVNFGGYGTVNRGIRRRGAGTHCRQSRGEKGYRYACTYQEPTTAVLGRTSSWTRLRPP
eukprot:SAG25_NODE_100_length_15542_cov_15.293337_10_plen_194_part_00